MNLLILGAGGHGINCLEIARSTGEYKNIAFLNDGHVGETICDCHVIGKLDDTERLKDKYDYAFVAFGDNERRRDLIQKLKETSYIIPTLISPLANVSKYSKVNASSVVFPFVSIEANSSVREGRIIATGTVIGHNAIVEQYCLIYENAVVRPYTHIGRLTTIGAGSIITMNSSIAEGSVVTEGSVFKIPIGKAKVDQAEAWTSQHSSQFGNEPGFF